MQLKPEQVSAHLKKGLAPCYVLAGQEPLLIQEALDAIRTAARKAGCSERETLDVDRSFDWNHLLELCATGSLFAERRIVELRLDMAPGDAGGSALKHLATSPPPDVLLIVIAGKLDARSRKAGWYAALEKAGAACYCWPVTPSEFPRWLSLRLQAAELHADGDAVTLLAQRTEGNLLAAAQDISKLALLHPNGRIGVTEVLGAVADAAHYGVFDWIDKMFAGDVVGTVRGLARLREEGEPLPALVGAIAMDLRKLNACLAAANEDLTRAGVFRMRHAAFRSALARTRSARVLTWLRWLTAIDAVAKSGGEASAWRELQALTLSIVGLKSQALATGLKPTIASAVPQTRCSDKRGQGQGG